MDKITCTNCGAENEQNVKYCTRCGHTLPKQEVPVVEIIPEPDTFTSRLNKRKELIGVIMGLLIMGLLGYTFQHFFFDSSVFSKIKSSAFDKVMVAAAQEINKNCPMMVDQDTRLDNVEALPGTVLQYNYTLVSITKSQVNTDTVKKYLAPGLIENVKTKPELQPYRQFKATFVYNYLDKDGATILKFSITPDMYE